jgi:hypothetical protein
MESILLGFALHTGKRVHLEVVSVETLNFSNNCLLLSTTIDFSDNLYFWQEIVPTNIIQIDF